MMKMFEKTIEYKNASHQRRETWGLRLREMSQNLNLGDSLSMSHVLPDCLAGTRPCRAALRSVERSIPCSTLNSLTVFILQVLLRGYVLLFAPSEARLPLAHLEQTGFVHCKQKVNRHGFGAVNASVRVRFSFSRVVPFGKSTKYA